MAALDTNVLLRLLLNDDARQSAIAVRLIRAAGAAGETLYVPISVALELEWVLRSRFSLSKAAVSTTFSRLLGAVELCFEASDALEWAVMQSKETTADFSDCVHTALVHRAGEQPFWTFDKAAARLAGAALLS